MVKANIFDFYYLTTVQKVSKYGVFSGPSFPVFGLNTEIQSKYRKLRTRKKLRIWTLFTQCTSYLMIDRSEIIQKQYIILAVLLTE